MRASSVTLPNASERGLALQRVSRSIVRRFVPGIAIATAAAFTIPANSATAQSGERYTLRGTDLALYNLVGRVHVTGGGSGSATATIVRRGRDASKLTVENGTVRGREALRVMYPDDQISVPDSPRRGRYRTETRVRDDGTFGDDNNTNRGRIFREGRRVRVSSDGGGLEAAADIELQVPNGVALRVYLLVGEATVRNVNGTLFVDVGSADVTVSDTKGALDVDAGSGNTTVTNADGTLNFDTGSGDVVMKNLSGPSLTLDTGSGSVRIDGATVDKVSLDTGSGDVILGAIRAKDISLDTGSGDVTLGFLSSVDMLSIDSGSGDVNLSFPATLSARLSVETGSGDISSDFPVQITSRSRDNLIGKIGEGAGRIVIETGSGNVRIRKNSER